MNGRRRQILEAFRRRVRHYGYDKTTMAEIAADVGISVGTLYLEFDSKEDILARLVEETAQEWQAAFREIAESHLPAGDKVREVLRARVALSDRCCREGAHAGEVVVGGMDRCRRKREEKEALYLGLLERLLAEGVMNGQLQLEGSGPAATARALRDAITPFLPPQSMALASEDVLARSDAVIEILVRGLQPGWIPAAGKV